jgi:hypothetical protein
MGLGLLKKVFRKILALLSKEQTIGTIKSDEQITRFGFNSNNFNKAGDPRHTIFRYNKNDGKLSVYRTDGLTEIRIWDIGKNIQQHRNQNLIGRVDFIKKAISAINKIHGTNLDIVPETSEHSLHADITNWPESENLYLAVKKEFIALLSSYELYQE